MHTNLYFVRHGETDWNVQGRFQGHTDIPLNATGQSQALQLRDTLRQHHFDAVYSSDLDRAIKTAKAIGQDRFPIVQDSRLRELFCGNWEGQTAVELTTKGEPIEQYLLHPLAVPPSGGESIYQLYERVALFLEEIIKAHHGQTVLLVSHGGTTRAALSHLLLASPDLYSKLMIDNCGVSQIVIEQSGRTRLAYLNGIPTPNC